MIKFLHHLFILIWLNILVVVVYVVWFLDRVTKSKFRLLEKFYRWYQIYRREI